MKTMIPGDVRKFLLQHIESVETINVLLLLYEHSGRAWTADEVGKELRTNEFSADMHLRALAQRAIVRFEEGSPAKYQSEPANAGIVASLARTFSERRVAVITLIYTRPDSDPDKEPDPVQAFADAFKLRKDK